MQKNRKLKHSVSPAAGLPKTDKGKYCNEKNCQKAASCLENKFSELYGKAFAHSNSFDSGAWNWGGAYSDHPFVGKIDLSECEECSE